MVYTIFSTDSMTFSVNNFPCTLWTQTIQPAWFWWGWDRFWPDSLRCSGQSDPAWCLRWPPLAAEGAGRLHRQDRWASWWASDLCCTGRKVTGSARSTQDSVRCSGPQRRRWAAPTLRCCCCTASWSMKRIKRGNHSRSRSDAILKNSQSFVETSSLEKKKSRTDLI